MRQHSTVIIKPSLLGYIIWFLAIFFFLYEFALRTILGTFTYQIIPELHLTPFTYAIVDSVYSLSFMLCAIPVGILTDKYGIRWTITIAMLVLALATFLYSFAPGFTDAVISRLLMGAGSSLSFVSVVVIIMMWFPRRRFAFLVGLSQFIATLGPMLGAGPLLLFVHHFHETWRTGLRNIGYVGLLAALLMLFFIRNKKKNKEIEVQYTQGVSNVWHYLKQLCKNKQVRLPLFIRL